MVIMNVKINAEYENEWYIVRHSGETPEIALHSALYYLTRAKDGPGLALTDLEVENLEQAAVERFREIILRDFDHDNADKPIYRGIERSIVNYRRYITFCERRNLDASSVRQLAARALVAFLEREIAEVIGEGRRSSIINCQFERLRTFALDLGVDEENHLLLNIASLCPEDCTT